MCNLGLLLVRRIYARLCALRAPQPRRGPGGVVGLGPRSPASAAERLVVEVAEEEGGDG